MRSRSPLAPSPAVLALAAFALAACSGPRVVVDQDPTADFAQYETYGFLEPLGTDAEQYGTLLSQHLRDAASRELEARGYALADVPDLLVNFTLETAERVRTTETPAGFYSHYGYGRAAAHGFTRTEVESYTEGTLRVDLVDTRRLELVWRGAWTRRLYEPDREAPREAVDRAVRQVFERYPYRAGSRVRADGPEDLEEVRALALRGDVEAQFLLGVAYTGQGGAPEDMLVAARWFRKAAERGFPPAQANLGLLHLEGCGVDQDDAEALRWLTAGAEGGSPEAQYTLGRMHLDGRGIPASDTEGLAWIRRAAVAGLPLAQCDLGLAHLQGRGVAEDAAEAARWFKLAAEQGSVVALERLGRLYEQGLGLERDPISALVCYRLAAESGAASAAVRAERLAEGLTTAQLALVDERLRLRAEDG